jgi:hypothetical protein
MKTIRLSFVLFWITQMPLCLFAQKDTINFLPGNGKVTGRIFANFYTGIGKGDKTSAFEVRRAYLGYKTQISRDFTAEAKLDIGSPNDLSEYSRIRRYAYFKIAAFCGDDAFDYDEGYRGNGQFWLAIQDSEEGDNLLECNGGIYPENGIPYSIPSLYNLTLIGTGPDSHNSVANFNRNAGGILANSIMVNQESGILIEYKEDVESSYNHFLNNKLQIKNNIFFDVKENDTTLIFNVYAEDGTDISEQNKEFRDYFFRAYNTVKNPGIQYSGDQYSLIPRDIIFTNLAPGSSDWFDPVNFKGAFGTYNWAANWTLLSQAGVLKD